MIETYPCSNQDQVNKMHLMLDSSTFQTLLKELQQAEKSKALEELQNEKSKVENIELV